MSEEEKKAIEELGHYEFRSKTIYNNKINKADVRDSKIIVNLIDRLQKENEELKENIKYLNYLRDYNSQLQAELVVERKHSISKDKIRNKIRKLNFEKILTETIQPSKQSYNYAVGILKELLEE